MNKVLLEHEFGHGAKPINPLCRKLRKLLRRKLGKSNIPFDWNRGYDVRNIIGPIAIKDQGKEDSCGGQAGAYFLEIQRRLQGIREGAISAKSVYCPIAYPGGGTTVSALEQQIATVGANLEATVPSYYVTGEPLSEAGMIEKSWMTDITTKDALTRAGYTPYDIDEDIESVAIALRDWGTVLWEIKGQNNGTWLTKYPKPPVKGGADIWYHFQCIIGAKIMNGVKTLIVLQSWGPNVGDFGIEYFTEDYFTAKGIVDCFTLIYDAHLNPIETPNMTLSQKIWQALCLWFNSQNSKTVSA